MAEWDELQHLSQRLGSALERRSATVSAAESCTAGGIAFALTSVDGSSHWFGQSFVTYSNEAKHKMLDVSQYALEQYGAVSHQVVEEMALGAALKANADYSMSVSGIAGPGGGSEEKPVGTVYFGWCLEGRVESEKAVFSGDRHAVRMQSIEFALKGLLQRI